MQDLTDALVDSLWQALAQSFTPVTDSLRQMLAQSFTPVTDSLRQILAQSFAAISEELSYLAAGWASQLREPVRRMLESAKLSAEEVAPVLAEAGFWLTPSMPLTLLREARRLKDEGLLNPDALRQMFLERYREHDFALLRTTVEGWQKKALFTPRMFIFYDALEAHIAGKYTLSVPALLPHIEGIAGQVVGIAPGRSRTVVEEAVNRGPELLSAVMKELVLSYVTSVAYIRVDFNGFSRWLEEKGFTEEQVLQRHTILHGVQINYASEENSLRAFLLLDALSWLNPVHPEDSAREERGDGPSRSRI